jgi:hypothetical protein
MGPRSQLSEQVDVAGALGVWSSEPPLHTKMASVCLKAPPCIYDNPHLRCRLSFKSGHRFRFAASAYDLDIKAIAVRPLNDRIGRHVGNMTRLNGSTQHDEFDRGEKGAAVHVMSALSEVWRPVNELSLLQSRSHIARVLKIAAMTDYLLTAVTISSARSA